MNLKLDFVPITLESHDERIYEKDLSISEISIRVGDQFEKK